MKHLSSVCLLALGTLLFANTAVALDGKVYSPQVSKGEAELEYAGTRTFDSDKTKNNVQENQFSIGYAFTDWWKTELYYAVFERGPGEPQDFRSTEFENIFQLTPTGKYWLDAGILASYHLAAKAGGHDSIELKLLLQKDFGKLTALVNAGGEREVGSTYTAGNDLASAENIRYRWSEYFQPGIEMQSDYGKLGDRNLFSQQEHYLGPIVYGQIIPGLKYEVGYYAGISDAAASSAMRFKLEYEMYF